MRRAWPLRILMLSLGKGHHRAVPLTQGQRPAQACRPNPAGSGINTFAVQTGTPPRSGANGAEKRDRSGNKRIYESNQNNLRYDPIRMRKNGRKFFRHGCLP